MSLFVFFDHFRSQTSSKNSRRHRELQLLISTTACAVEAAQAVPRKAAGLRMLEERCLAGCVCFVGHVWTCLLFLKIWDCIKTLYKNPVSKYGFVEKAKEKKRKRRRKGKDKQKKGKRKDTFST